MPVGLVAAIATIAAAATTTGVTLYEAANQPGTPKPSTTPSPLTTSQNSQQAAAVGQQLPTLQSLTGGSVSPEYASQFGATQAGVANDPQATGNIQAAINQFFGLSAPGSTGLTPPGGGAGGAGDIISLLSKPKSATPGASPEIGPDFVNNLLSSDAFKGLTG